MESWRLEIGHSRESNEALLCEQALIARQDIGSLRPAQRNKSKVATVAYPSVKAVKSVNQLDKIL
jgi:hypothetical protein